jgi:hypothetical protein
MMWSSSSLEYHVATPDSALVLSRETAAKVFSENFSAENIFWQKTTPDTHERVLWPAFFTTQR